jgi:hypothetical protein|tara:strand:- start:4107 stop:4628 length:522 start_codon:yes stop_codon:yes gene_type:complete
MKETVIVKKSFFVSQIDNKHMLETTKTFIETNKEKFTERSWDCEAYTSYGIYKNILFAVGEFIYLREYIEKQISKFLKKPFMITSSWINVYENGGYQEFHNHIEKNLLKQGAGVFYLTDDNSEIEFAVFSENTFHSYKPKLGELIVFDSDLHHRVKHSKKERMSLAFNFKYED